MIIARLLAKHPADRFESAAEVVELLDGCLAHLQQPLQVELPRRYAVKPSAMKPDSCWLVRSIAGEAQVQPAQPPRRIFSQRGLIMTGSLFLASLLGVLTMQLTNPRTSPEIGRERTGNMSPWHR